MPRVGDRVKPRTLAETYAEFEANLDKAVPTNASSIFKRMAATLAWSSQDPVVTYRAALERVGAMPLPPTPPAPEPLPLAKVIRMGPKR